MTFSFLISSSRLGGAQIYTRNYALLLSNYFCTEIITGTDDSTIFNELPKVPLKIFKGLNVPFNLIAIIKLYKYFRNKKTNIIVTNSFAAGINGRIVGLLLNIKTIYVTHGWSYQYKHIFIKHFAFFIEYIFSKFSYTLCISKSDLEIAINKFKISSNKIIYLKNRFISFSNQNNVSSHCFKQNIKNILFVGRNEYPKRLDLYIELSKYFLDYNFFIVGANQNEMTSKLISNNIIFLGKIQDFHKYFEYDLFCLFSDSEGLPLSAIEAAANGIPLLLSNVGGCSELLVNNNAILVNNDINEIVLKFNLLLRNYHLYAKSAESIKENFKIDSNNHALFSRAVDLLKNKLSLD